MPQSFKDLGVTSRPLPVRTRMFGRAWPLRAPVRDGRVPSWQELAAANNFPSVMCMVSTSIVTFQPLLFCFSTSTICSVFWFPSSLFTYIWLVVCIKIQKFYKIVKQCKRKKKHLPWINPAILFDFSFLLFGCIFHSKLQYVYYELLFLQEKLVHYPDCLVYRVLFFSILIFRTMK